MRSHLIAVALVVLASVWLGHGERVPARALDTWVSYRLMGCDPACEGLVLHLQRDTYVLTRCGCPFFQPNYRCSGSVEVIESGYWSEDEASGDLLLKDDKTGQTRWESLEGWREIAGPPKFLR